MAHDDEADCAEGIDDDDDDDGGDDDEYICGSDDDDDGGDDGGNEDGDNSQAMVFMLSSVPAYILYECTASKDVEMTSSATSDRTHRNRGIPPRPLLLQSATNPCATA